MAGEVVEFENGEKGIASNLEESSVGIVVLGKGDGLREGTFVKTWKIIRNSSWRCYGWKSCKCTW